MTTRCWLVQDVWQGDIQLRIALFHNIVCTSLNLLPFVLEKMSFVPKVLCVFYEMRYSFCEIIVCYANEVYCGLPPSHPGNDYHRWAELHR